ncbi:hypothetical protein OHB26_24595 [Nocardia sp. NBC_01503]|uniref:hypothetical protein n=1 Tax=Nocardia sp. NBC_01503 TaxID=2975997 RepID=UPI002E7B1F39|nr:hypothetical protein [Nocardia sp. NBC_01503]WTL30123.1 hypothetical protein OHB26_24595 [Nocardia sp. NBC_01503]
MTVRVRRYIHRWWLMRMRHGMGSTRVAADLPGQNGFDDVPRAMIGEGGIDFGVRIDPHESIQWQPARGIHIEQFGNEPARHRITFEAAANRLARQHDIPQIERRVACSQAEREGEIPSVRGGFDQNGFALRAGTVTTEPAAARVRDFEVAGKTRTGVSVPGSEHFALPRSHPNLRTVDVFLGLPPVAARGLQIGSRLAGAAGQFGPLRHGLEAVLARTVKGSTGGPDARARARTRG